MMATRAWIWEALGGGLLIAVAFHHIFGRSWDQGGEHRRPRYIGPTSEDLVATCRLGPTQACRWIFVWFFIFASGFLYDIARSIEKGEFSISPFGFLGFISLILADWFLTSWIRYHLAQIVLDIFELDEALLPIVQHFYDDEQEPSLSAYQAALAATYRYIGTVTWGTDATHWIYIFRARFFKSKGPSGWYIPRYPWAERIGGPLLADLDADILLVTERLTDPRPTPTLPGPYNIRLKTRYNMESPTFRVRAPETMPLPPAIQPVSILPLVVLTEEEDDLSLEREQEDVVVYVDYNAELRKFARVRYPVLFGLRARTTSKESILVRSADGLLLQVPKIIVTYELFNRGRLVREARRALPPEQWQAMVWDAVVRLLRREASHWDIRSATDLPEYVIQATLESAFRKVFERYTAAQLLDRLHRATLDEALQAWPEEIRKRIKEEVDHFLRSHNPVSVDEIRAQILEELNGPESEGYPLAEKRGLRVVHLSFGDWSPPKAIREVHRQAMKQILALSAETQPSPTRILRRRMALAQAQQIADMLAQSLPPHPRSTPFYSPVQDAEGLVPWMRQAWIGIVDYLIESIAWHPRVQGVFQGASLDSAVTFEPELLDSTDAVRRDRNLAIWLQEARSFLIGHPWGIGPEAPSDVSPFDFLGP